ncbi:MAG: hypothetical protein R3A52_12450 [Polyangiales bacterium]
MSESAYRPTPGRRPAVTVREVTPRSRAALAVSALALAAAVGFASRRLAERFTAENHVHGSRCEVEVFRGLSHDAEVVPCNVGEVREARGRDRLGAGPFIRLDGRRLLLPRRALYAGVDRVWRDDDDAVNAATAFFQYESTSKSFDLRVVHGTSTGAIALALAALSLLAVAFTERRTRVFTLSVDPDARSARGRSIGLGGPTLDREHAVGADPKAVVTNDPGASHLPLLRLVSSGEPALPILTGHSYRHTDTLERVASRMNDALARGSDADPSRSLALRLGPSVALVVAAVALILRVGVSLATLPETTGTVVVRNTAERCDFDGMTLLRGAEMQWDEPAGEHTRVFTHTEGMLRSRQVTVVLGVAPGRRTEFDCAALRDGTDPVRVGPR